MKKIYKQFSFIFGAFLIASCEIHNPAEPVPAYIHIDEFAITTDYVIQGTNSNKITDVWVYLDDELQGCYELPATFPIIATGNHKLKVKPGIKVNGISSERIPYPFYRTYEQIINFKAGEIFNLNPTSSYNSYTKFAFMEDFESTGITFTPHVYSDTSLKIIELPDTNVFEGSKSAIAYVDGYTFFECATINAFTLPKGGSAVFLEFNYKCNYEFSVYIYAYGFQSMEKYLALHVNPSNSWNKIYVNLTPIMNLSNNATDYKIAFGMDLTNSGTNNSSMLLDNIKLIN